MYEALYWAQGIPQWVCRQQRCLRSGADFWWGQRQAIRRRTSGQEVRSMKQGGVLVSGWGRVSSEGHLGGLLEEAELSVSLK